MPEYIADYVEPGRVKAALSARKSGLDRWEKRVAEQRAERIAAIMRLQEHARKIGVKNV